MEAMIQHIPRVLALKKSQPHIQTSELHKRPHFPLTKLRYVNSTSSTVLVWLYIASQLYIASRLYFNSTSKLGSTLL